MKMSGTNKPDDEVGATVKVTEVTKSDVLSGRGNGVAIHEGNQFYSSLVKENQEEYQTSANGKRKKEIALNIIDSIKRQEPKGRFLKHKRFHPFVWVVQNDRYAMKKVTQALREKPKEKKAKKSNSTDKSCELTTLKRSMKIESYKRYIPIDATSSTDFKSQDFYSTDEIVSQFTSQERTSKELDSQDFSNLNISDRNIFEDIISHIETKDEETVSDEKSVALVRNPDFRPTKRSLVGTSSKKFTKWMSCQSHIKLINESLKSFDANSYRELVSITAEEVRESMDKFQNSGSGIDEIEEIKERKQVDAFSTSLVTGFLDDGISEEIKCRKKETERRDQRRKMMMILASEEISMTMKKLNIFSSDQSDSEDEETSPEFTQA